MSTKSYTPWALGALAILAAGGLAVYGWSARKARRQRPYGKPVDRKKAGGIQGGVKTGGGGRGNAWTAPDWNSPFDMNYEGDVKRWVAPKQVAVLSPVDAGVLAKTLYEARGGAWWQDDDEDAVRNVFAKRLRDKVQVANLSRAFWQRYQLDLWDYLRGFLSDDELERYVHAPVRNLPNYRTL